MRCNILSPWFLTDQHLMAERRELRMIPPLVLKRLKSGWRRDDSIPKRYVLGAGHMLFWVDKLSYLEKRYDDLTQEMVARSFNPNKTIKFDVQEIHNIVDGSNLNLFNDWTPELEDFDIIVTRLRERIEQKFDWYRYCKTPITRKWFDVTYPLPYHNK